MMLQIHWEFPVSSDVYALGWARGECLYEITRSAVPTRTGRTITYTLWTVAEDDGKLLNIASAPSSIQLVRAAEKIEESYDLNNPEPVFDKSDDPEYVN